MLLVLGISELREQRSCSCCPKDSIFVGATKSPVAFKKAVCCEKAEFNGLELPHNPGFTPKFTAFKCVVDGKLPPHKDANICDKCGLKGIVPRGCPIMESLSSKAVSWNKRVETPYKTKKDEWSTKVICSGLRDSLAINFFLAVACFVDDIKGT